MQWERSVDKIVELLKQNNEKVIYFLKFLLRIRKNIKIILYT